MRSFGPIVQPLVLAMFDPGSDLGFGRSVGTELVSDQHAGLTPPPERDCCINWLRLIVCVDGCAGSCGIEDFADELDLALNAWLFVMDVATFDGAHRLNPAQGCLG